MKRKWIGENPGRRVMILCLLCVIAFAVPERSGAVPERQKSKTQRSADEGQGWSIGVGATAEYLWWRPAFRDRILTNKFLDTVAPFLPVFDKSFHINSAFSAGPVLTIGFPRGFSFSSTFLWSSWYNVRTSSSQGDPISNFNYTTTKSDLDRWELDAALNYSISNIFNTFIGVRYSGCTLDYQSLYWQKPTPTPIGSGSRKDSYYGFGPEIGLNAHVRLAGPLSLSGDFSALYLYTSYNAGKYILATFVIDPYHIAYHTLGFDISLALSWEISSAHTTISLGFRYQYLHYMKWTSKSDDTVRAYLFSGLPSSGPIDVPEFLTSDDHLYGITLSARYEFEL
jgi:hypothetical protein